MVVKTITITEDAYEGIKAAKESDESFSDLFLRVFPKKLTVSQFVKIVDGQLTLDERKGIAQRIRENRGKLQADITRRTDDIRTRLKRVD